MLQNIFGGTTPLVAIHGACGADDAPLLGQSPATMLAIHGVGRHLSPPPQHPNLLPP